ncbi:hypothetical protein KDM41_05410 [bacterium]|nr:hypothetical protein [bacterium]
MRRLVLALLVPILLIVSLAGCSTVGTRAPRPAGGRAHDPTAPLFADDAAEIDDLDIARMLETDLHLPPRIRIGMIHLSHRRERDGRIVLANRPDEMPRVHDAFDELMASPRVCDVSYLPTMLVPHVRQPGTLRAAAARYQADWLLLFDSRTTILRKSPIFGSDKSRVWCEAECMVLDVRTGLVTFSSQARVSVTDVDPDEIWSGDMAISLAEEHALGEAMTTNTVNLARYLAALEG